MFRKLALHLLLMRLHKPTGIWLLLWPCWWSIGMASTRPYPDIKYIALFAFGAIVMRGAGCVMNDIIDRDIDRNVARTKTRPLASGALSVREALWLLAVLLAFGFIILLELPPLAILLGIASLAPVAAYPYMKRIFAWPQLFLGFTFNMGALVAWSAAANSLNIAALVLYAACICWTLGYDTIYAHQDKMDDEKLGVKSTAVALKEHTRIMVSLFYLAMIILLMLAGTLQGIGGFFYYSLIPAALHLAWQVKTVKLEDPKSCFRKFRSNGWFGWIIFAGILAEKMHAF